METIGTVSRRTGGLDILLIVDLNQRPPHAPWVSKLPRIDLNLAGIPVGLFRGGKPLGLSGRFSYLAGYLVEGGRNFIRDIPDGAKEAIHSSRTMGPAVALPTEGNENVARRTHCGCPGT